ncbi:MAG: hypothetical protein IJW27_01010 [Clostridia bacterium]|nr:hypothetical protein [Clostridia bacterium]
MKKRIISLVIAAVLLLGAVPVVSSCSPPPELSEVKDRLVYLLRGVEPINNIFFGEGLVSYNDYGFEIDGVHQDGLFGEDDYNSTLEGEDIYLYYTEVLESYATKDGNIIEQYKTIAEIKAEAEKYYSKSYLETVYPIVFVDDYYGEHGHGTRAKYIEETEEYMENGEIKSRVILYEYAYHNPQITAESPATVYDFDTMEIVVPSTGETLIVEIQGYNENYYDPDTGKLETGWHKVILQFVLQDGEWYLDGPSY